LEQKGKGAEGTVMWENPRISKFGGCDIRDPGCQERGNAKKTESLTEGAETTAGFQESA